MKTHSTQRAVDKWVRPRCSGILLGLELFRFDSGVIIKQHVAVES